MNEGDHVTTKSNGSSSSSSTSQPPQSSSSASQSDDVLMEQEFTLYPKSTSATLQLTNSYIKIMKNKSKSPPKYIYLDDVVGCHVLEGNVTTSSKHFICLFYYPMKKKMFSKTTRHRCTKSFGIQCNPQAQENERQANKWKNVIKLIISGRKLTPNDVEEMDKSVNEVVVRRRNFLVYVNPFSGSKCADEMYKHHLKKLFAEAEIDHKCIKTERRGHAHEHVKEVDLNEYDAIIIVSGDGLIHEVINGLMKRSDWSTAIRTPIGVVPGGSGNALAAAIAYASFGRHPLPALTPYTSIFEVVRGRPKPIDMMEVKLIKRNNEDDDDVTVEQPSGAGDQVGVKTKQSTTDGDQHGVIYSILGTVHGIIADVDIESEKLRALGGDLRSLLFGIWRTLKLRHYRGVELSYLPMESDKWVEVDSEHGFVSIKSLLLSHIGTNEMVNNDVPLHDECIRLTWVRGDVTRSELMAMWGGMNEQSGIVAGGEEAVEKISSVRCRQVRIRPHKPSSLVTVDGEVLKDAAGGDTVVCRMSDASPRVLTTS